MKLSTFSSVGIVGMGQIGTSLALGLRHQVKVTGFDTDAGAQEAAALEGIAQAPSVENLMDSVDLCIFAIPAGRLKSLVRAMTIRKRAPAAVLADVCSTKLDIDSAMGAYQRAVGGFSYVGLHPLAGNEKRGIAGAEAELFRGRTIAVATGESADPGASLSVAALLSAALGSQQLFVNPALHDRITNFTIQLPHVFAYMTSSFANSISDASLLALLSGNSFADVTRVARSSPEMVGSFLYANREILLESLSKLESRIAALRDALEAPEEEIINALLASYAPRLGEFSLQRYARSFDELEKLDPKSVISVLEDERVLATAIVAEAGKLQVSGSRLGPV